MAPRPVGPSVDFIIERRHCALATIADVLCFTQVETTAPDTSLIHGVQIVGNRGFSKIHIQNTAVLTPQLRGQGRTVFADDVGLL